MKLLKVLFLLFLFFIVCFSIYHIETRDNVSNNSYFLAIIAIVIFTLCFLLLALKIKISGFYLSLEEDLANLQEKQKQLSILATAFYKLHRISVALRDIKGSSTKIAKMNLLIEDKIKHLLDDNEIDTFSEELSNIIKNPN